MARQIQDGNINSFVGYIINIPEFNETYKLKELTKKDYYYDENKKILTLIISEQIHGGFFTSAIDRYYPDNIYQFTKEKNNFISINYNYFKELKEFINNYTVQD